MVRGATVLVIGGGASPAGAIGEALAERGYRVVRASREEEALRVALREEPEAVLVRLELPDDQAVELVQALQAALPGTAIAALVGAEDGAAVARAREAGLTLTDYFAEPLDVGAIESWIEEAVGGG